MMNYWRSSCSIFLLVLVVVTVHCMTSDLQKLEDEFLKSGVGNEKNRTYNTLFVNWTDDRRSALCERALNNTEQFHTTGKTPIWPTLEVKNVVFKHEKPKHGPVKAHIMRCPVGKYIYESGRLNDCYYIMAEEKDGIFIEKEQCDVGLM